jgi:hypothetical protein
VRTPSEIGRASRRKGIQAERDLAKYLREWWPRAERKTDTGWRSKDRVSEDHGDIRGTGYLVWQLKNVADMSDLDVERALVDAENQAAAAFADYGLLVQRRQGKRDPAHWWAYMRVSDLCSLADKRSRKVHAQSLDAVVRIELHDLVNLLVLGGFAGEDEV